MPIDIENPGANAAALRAALVAAVGERMTTMATSASAAANGAALAADAVAAAGAAIIVPAGTYDIDMSDTPITGRAHLIFRPGAKLRYANGDKALYFSQLGSVGASHAVSAFALASPAAGDTTSDTTRITLSTPANAANYDRGDVIFVGSQNGRTYYSGNTNFAAEMAVVESVDEGNGYIYTRGKLALHSLYTTSPFVRKMPNLPVVIEDVVVEASGDPTGTYGISGQPAIQLIACQRPRLHNPQILSSWHVGIEIGASFGAKVINPLIQDCPGNPDDNRFGYGIATMGAVGALHVVGGLLERCRHCITTNCPEDDAYDSSIWYRYGDATWPVFQDIVAYGAGAVAFDEHEPTWGASWIGCKAIGAARASETATAATGFGFNSRGVNSHYIGCVAQNCQAGFQVTSTSIAHETQGETVLKDCVVDNDRVNNEATHGIFVQGDAAVTSPQVVTVEGLSLMKTSRGVFIESGFTGRFKLSHSNITGIFDIGIRIQASCTMDVVFNHFDTNFQNTGELLFSIDNNNTVAMVLVGNTIRPKNGTTPSAWISVASGATLNLSHAVNYGLTTLTTGAGTINKTALTVAT